MKVLFFGTPQIAVPFLDWLYQHQQVVGVVCQPDRPVGRGYELTPPPVKVFAASHQLPLFQPEGPWTDDVVAELKKTQADVGIAIAYGRILPTRIFLLPRLGTINLHFSLLPMYRGAAPMQWTLVRGETETGVSAFWLDEGMDTGPLSHQQKILVDPNENASTLKEKLVTLGLQVLEQFFKDAEKNRIVKNPQQGVASMAPLLTKEMGRINWNHSAQDIHNQVRGLVEWPGAWTTWASPDGSKKLKVLKTVISGKSVSGMAAMKPGTPVVTPEKNLLVKTGSDVLELLTVQPEGKNKMSGWDFFNGARFSVGNDAPFL